MKAVHQCMDFNPKHCTIHENIGETFTSNLRHVAGHSATQVKSQLQQNVLVRALKYVNDYSHESSACAHQSMHGMSDF